MRSAVLVVALIASAPLSACGGSKAAAAKPPVVTTVVVPLPRRPVGMRWIATDAYTIEAELRHGTKSAWFGTKRHRRTETEILAVDLAGVPTRVAVIYHERKEEDHGPGAPAPKRSAIAGSSYVAAAVDGKVTATRADGGPVRDAEQREIALDLESLGKPVVMEAILARPWQVGVKVDLTADELSRLNEGTPANEPRPVFVSFTLHEVRGDEAELLMRTRMQLRGPTSMTIDANGRVLIDLRTGWTTRLSLSGAVNGTTAGMPFSGNMSARSEVTFQP